MTIIQQFPLTLLASHAMLMALSAMSEVATDTLLVVVSSRISPPLARNFIKK
jgi:hypothetical protein